MVALLLGGECLTKAAASSVQLRYQRDAAASGCPDRADFEEAVRVRVGRAPFAADGARSIQVRIERGSDGVFAGTLVAPGAGGATTRILTEPADCRELVEDLAVTVAVWLDPLAALQPPVSVQGSAEVSPVPAPPPEVRAAAAGSGQLPAVHRSQPTVAVLPPAGLPSWRFGAGLALAVGSGGADRVWPQARLVVERPWQTYAFSASVSAWTILANTEDEFRRFKAIALTTTIGICWSSLDPLLLCPVLTGGVVHGTLGVNGYSVYLPLVSGGARLMWPVSRRRGGWPHRRGAAHPAVSVRAAGDRVLGAGGVAAVDCYRSG